jgi:transposase
MRIGNVIESPDGSKWIVTEINDRVVSAVAFDASNSSATARLDDYERVESCRCEGMDNGCPCCGGTNSVTVQVKGWKRSKVLADCVQDFILARIKKTWGLK